jgi:hypothetical protein
VRQERESRPDVDLAKPFHRTTAEAPLNGATTRIRLEDPPGLPARTTADLVVSLRDRLAALRAISGADAIGSLVAGYAAVGRAAGRTAEGKRLGDALRAGRPGSNGMALWSALGLDDLTTVVPSPVLDHLRNDLALLLADDLDPVLRTHTSLERAESDDSLALQPAPVDPVDYLVGMWAFSRELVLAVEELASATIQVEAIIEATAISLPPDEPLLR